LYRYSVRQLADYQNDSQEYRHPDLIISSFWLALALYRMVQGPESPSHRHPDENQDHSSDDPE